VLIGERVQLRPIREADLPAYISAHHDVRNRGAYFPLGVLSEPVLRRRFAETGFLVDYLTGAKKQHRIHLVIVPGNEASRRVAEKCGFVPEGTVRGAFFNGGRNHDVLLYSLLRTDPRPWHSRAEAPAAASDGRTG
jgi:L-amino acid N-acyltransferase YncA